VIAAIDGLFGKCSGYSVNDRECRAAATPAWRHSRHGVAGGVRRGTA
jgi:hypothetical protein